MEVKYIGSAIERFTDSDLEFLNIMFEIIKFSDPYCEVYLIKDEDKLITHVTLSNFDFKNDLIQNLLYINKFLHIKVEFSKSLKIQKLVSFIINI